MIEKSSINFDLSLYLLSYSRRSHIKHSYTRIKNAKKANSQSERDFLNKNI
jgi:hypothetical protein